MINESRIVLNNGVSIPQVGLGVFQNPDGETTVNAVREALSVGYRHIDTARIYGNESSVGEGLRQSGVARRDVFVTTKLWNEDIRQERTREAFLESLDRLGLDYVDMYLIHWPADHWQRAWEEMAGLYEEHRIRAIGVSNFQPHHLRELMTISSVLPAVDQIESSPLFANNETISFARSRHIDVEAWSPLGGTGGSLLSDPHLLALAAKYGKSPAQIVIRWHIQRGVIVIPKSTHAERIRENIDVADFALSSEDMAAIDSMETGTRVGADPDHFDF
ncbi:aldo/keto reductase [uncultured Bifidobacterium sp.]|uniref:aldo/keto reductase n=1 Tax=uncultured Bifidobacterium sp. TaxID=165187 RepID=UPI00260C2F70|nr:aldo/keto reductase [uncultured Bifidobacterium sp.]